MPLDHGDGVRNKDKIHQKKSPVVSVSTLSRGVAGSKYVGWTDGERAARAYNGSLEAPPPCKNSSELYQFQERATAKVGGGVDMSTPVHPVATPLTLRSDLSYVCYHSPSSE